MRLHHTALWAAFFAGCLLSSASWAASYFVDSLAGIDSNSGLAESAPWKTLAKVNGTAMPFGSTVYLKRGSVWREQLTIPSSGLSIDAYGEGPLPTIDSSAPVTDWSTSDGGGGWGGGGAIGYGIYTKAVALAPGGVGALGNITENGVFMTHTPWTGTASGTLKNAPLRSFTFNHQIGKLYIKPSSNPAGNVYLASTLLVGIRGENKSDITIQNLNIRRPSLHGIVFNNCNRCSGRNSTISDGGGAVSFAGSTPPLYTGNGVEYSGVSDGGLVDGLSIANMFDSGVSPQSFVPNSRLSNISFQNTTIERCGYAGVEMSALPSGRPSTLSNITVAGVTIRDSGRGWSGNRLGANGHGVLIQANGGAGTMSGVALQGVQVVNSVGDGIRLSGEVGTTTLNRLILTGNNYGVASTNLSGTAVSYKLVLSSSLVLANRNYGVIYHSASSAGFNVFHNTFFDNGAINFAIYAQNGQAYLKNNIFASSVPKRQIYVDGSNALRGPDVNHNCYLDGPNMIQYRGRVYHTLPPFTAAIGFETGGVSAPNVLFNNPAVSDFGLQAGSPCVGRGATNTGVALDLVGSAYKTPPSSGALERYP